MVGAGGKSVAVRIYCLILFVIARSSLGMLPSMASETWQRVVSDNPIEVFEDRCHFLLGGGLDDGAESEWARVRRSARQELCDCLSSAPLGQQLCEPGGALDEQLELLRQLSFSSLPKAFQSHRCSPVLFNQQVAAFLDEAAKSCHSKGSFAQAYALSGGVNESCWKFSTMLSDGCVQATPCGASANLKFLPIRFAPDRVVHSPVKLCHPELSALHMRKDPAGDNQAFQYPFINFLVNGQFHHHTVYAPGNCHGAASALAGGVLGSQVITKVDYHGPHIREQCGDLVNEGFLIGQTIEQLGLDQVSPNMTYRQCEPSDCGRVSMVVTGCESGRVQAYAFISGMCVGCFENQLMQSGYVPLTEADHWMDLKPGCVLNAVDHSVTLLNKNSGLCYFYETTNPYGPTQLRVRLCADLWQKFPRRSCPTVPFEFDLEN